MCPVRGGIEVDIGASLAYTLSKAADRLERHLCARLDPDENPGMKRLQGWGDSGVRELRERSVNVILTKRKDTDDGDSQCVLVERKLPGPIPRA